MNDGGKSPRNAQEIADFFARERKAQEMMDVFYQSKGHTIVTRKGNKGWDLILQSEDGKQYCVEEKFRFCGKRSDILVEVLQDLVSGDLGWFHHVRCKYLHYVFCDDEDRPFLLWRIL